MTLGRFYSVNNMYRTFDVKMWLLFRKIGKNFWIFIKINVIVFYIFYNSKNKKYTSSYVSDLRKLIKLNLNLNDFHKHFKKL